MIKVFRASGNHSNRLFQAIHFEAFCKDNGLEYSNPSFADMADYYGVEKKKWHKPFCTITQTLFKFRLLKGLDCNNNEEQERNENILQTKKSMLVGGWNFRVFVLTEKYQDFFIQKYTLLPQYYENNSLYQRLSKIDRETHVVVGVHVRRGDYRTWQDGKYFFEDNVYQKYMDDLASEIRQSSKTPLFVVFSNEELSIAEQDDLVISRNDWFIDQYLMSQCDYLMGPPSTFTLWASYIGKIKYYHFENSEDKVALDKFKYCVG